MNEVYSMKKLTVSIFTMFALLFSDNTHNNEQMDELLKQTFQVIWQEAMTAKHQAATVLPNIREELLENLCSSAPAVYFTTHADLSDSLTQAENTSASVFVSTNNQNSWSTGYVPITYNKGSALGSTIQSVALYVDDQDDNNQECIYYLSSVIDLLLLPDHYLANFF